MTDKIYEWHTALSLNRRLRQLIPRTTLLRWIGEKKLKTYGHRGAAFAFDPADIERLEIQETARRIRLAAEALPPSDPGQMSDAQLGDAYAGANSEGQSTLWMEISKRRERGGQETMRQISDAMARRAGKLQPMIDKFVGVYWNPETKQTTKTQGKTK
jgi:hypothetical protein